MINQIQARLPVKSLKRFLSVSKVWNSLISDPHLAAMHLKQSEKCIHSSRLMSVDVDDPNIDRPERLPHDFHITDSCNGLLLVSTRRSYGTYLCNPTTRELRKLPSTLADEPASANNELVPISLGYDEVNNDYKVVAAHFCTFSGSSGTRRWTDGAIYSLKADIWTRIGSLNEWRIAGSHTCQRLHGSLHWLTRPKSHYDFGSITGYPKAIANLWVYDGRLSIAISEPAADRQKSAYDIWVMEEYRDESSWKLLFKIPAEPSLVRHFYFAVPRLLWRLGDGKLLLQFYSSFVQYDPKEGFLDVMYYCKSSPSLLLAL
uniref:F-box associated beta-propeller type 1 domain-containing protein n=1 Tax=Kalanchoe fedtschenkoi TaxID=63787 RepID=A0A7N0ZVG0_KALFE